MCVEMTMVYCQQLHSRRFGAQICLESAEESLRKWPACHPHQRLAGRTWPSALEAMPRYMMTWEWRRRSRMAHSRWKSAMASPTLVCSTFTATSIPFQRPLYTCVIASGLQVLNSS